MKCRRYGRPTTIARCVRYRLSSNVRVIIRNITFRYTTRVRQKSRVFLHDPLAVIRDLLEPPGRFANSPARAREYCRVDAYACTGKTRINRSGSSARGGPKFCKLVDEMLRVSARWLTTMPPPLPGRSTWILYSAVRLPFFNRRRDRIVLCSQFNNRSSN